MFKCMCVWVCLSISGEKGSPLWQNIGLWPKPKPWHAAQNGPAPLSRAEWERKYVIFLMTYTKNTHNLWGSLQSQLNERIQHEIWVPFLFFQHLLFVCQRNLFDGGRRARQRVCRSARWCIMFHWFIALFMRSIWETELCDSRWKILNIWLHIKLKSKMLDRLFSQTNSLRFFKWNLYLMIVLLQFNILLNIWNILLCFTGFYCQFASCAGKYAMQKLTECKQNRFALCGVAVKFFCQFNALKLHWNCFKTAETVALDVFNMTYTWYERLTADLRHCWPWQQFI